MKYYLRFKDIPDNELSNIYRGDAGIIGQEKGVSVFELTKVDGKLRLLFPVYIEDELIVNNDNTPEACSSDFEMLWWRFYKDKIPAYIVTGDEVGFGSDGEPLLKNIKIINKLSKK